MLTTVPNCQAILQSYVPTLKSQYPFLDIKTFELGDPSNYEALAKLEKTFNRRGHELPVIFIGDQMLSGDLEIMEKATMVSFSNISLKATLSLLCLRLKLPPPGRLLKRPFQWIWPIFIRKGAPSAIGQATCLNYTWQRSIPSLNVTRIDLNTPDGKRLNETLATRLNLPPEKRLIAPSIFIGNDYLSPKNDGVQGGGTN